MTYTIFSFLLYQYLLAWHEICWSLIVGRALLSSTPSPYFLSFSINSVESGELKTELVRKIIHFSIALSPSMAAINKPLTVIFLIIGTLGYTFMEYLRFSGVKIPVISALTSMASRARDIGHFVIGPVTLGLGALLALLLYPSPVASIAIYALAFGDGFASLVGRFLGKLRPAFLHGKSIEGSLACFMVVLICAFRVSGNVYISLVAAFTATVIEALPLEDYDNMVLPVTVGLMVKLVSPYVLIFGF